MKYELFIKATNSSITATYLNLFAQPKPFDYENARKIYDKLYNDTKSEEGIHYREYVEKYKDAGYVYLLICILLFSSWIKYKM